jgi:hypothetical protein
VTKGCLDDVCDEINTSNIKHGIAVPFSLDFSSKGSYDIPQYLTALNHQAQSSNPSTNMPRVITAGMILYGVHKIT